MLHSQVIIVTGASRGLGRAMAMALAESGASVVVAARTTASTSDSPSTIEDVVRMIEAGGGTALAVQVRNLVQRTVDHYGRVDGLVNNAGLMVGDVAFADTTPSLWREILDTNLWGAFLCCRAVVPAMIRQRGGVIINISSGAAVRTGFLNLPYGVSKAGLDRLTLGLSSELQGFNIACVSLSPSISATDTVRRMYPHRSLDGWAQPPNLTARALCTLLENEPMKYSGQVLSVREVLDQRR
jgi:NAD(P)-dependent dehydrogenase (short-subunit alcohol dehydrogenase family)